MKQIRLLILIVLAVGMPVVVLSQSAESEANKAYAAGRYSEAAEGYALAAKKANSNNDLQKEKALKQKANKAKKAAQILTQANQAYNSKNYDLALAKYTELLNLNANDPIAKKRKTEIANKQATAPTEQKEKQQANTEKENLAKAMESYSNKRYNEALYYFSRAGESNSWSEAEQTAYNDAKYQAQLFTDYQNIGISSDTDFEQRAITFITKYPNSSEAKSVRNKLYEYYSRKGEMEKANKYRPNEETVDNTTGTKTTASRGYTSKSRYSMSRKSRQNRSPWEPKIGIGCDMALIGKMEEVAVPVGVRLLKAEKRFNIEAGLRYSIRPSSSSYYTNSTMLFDSTFGYFSYWQLSPYANISYRFGTDPDRVAVYFAGGIAANYNCMFRYRENPSGGKRTTYKPIEVLTPITFTGRAEAGMGSQKLQFYVYGTYDIIRPISENSIENLKIDPTTKQMLLLSEMEKTMRNRWIYGFGVRYYFN